MKPRLLVVSTVHPAEDPRIRRKLIGSLSGEWSITHAAHGRAPTDRGDITWRELSGNRLVRWLRSGALLLRGNYEAASLHDPELLPLALLASLRRKVVFDVHENIPAQIETKDWLPRLLRRPFAGAARWLLRLAERRVSITLAEDGYRDLFTRDHPVFPNYLVEGLPAPRPADPEIGLVYLGDITEARGALLAVEAAGRAGAGRLSLLGRCSADLRSRMQSLADEHHLQLTFHGFVSHARALEIAAGAVVGLSPLLDIPNYRHSLPTKVLEYLALGVPTLAADLPGTREIIDSRPGVVLLPPGKVDAWTAAIASTGQDEGLRRAAADGASGIRDSFTWPDADVRTFYRGLLPA